MHARSGTHFGILETIGQLQYIISKAIQIPKDEISQRIKATIKATKLKPAEREDSRL